MTNNNIDIKILNTIKNKVKNVAIYIEKKINQNMKQNILFNNGPLDIFNNITWRVSNDSKGTYTINKKNIYLCLRGTSACKNNICQRKNDNIYDEKMLLHVALHEFAHCLCNEKGHTKKFWKIENLLTKYTNEMNNSNDTKYKGKYELPKNSELDSKYCMKLDRTGRIDDDIIESNFSFLDYLKYIGIFLLLFIFFYYLFNLK